MYFRMVGNVFLSKVKIWLTVEVKWLHGNTSIDRRIYPFVFLEAKAGDKVESYSEKESIPEEVPEHRDLAEASIEVAKQPQSISSPLAKLKTRATKNTASRILQVKTAPGRSKPRRRSPARTSRSIWLPSSWAV